VAGGFFSFEGGEGSGKTTLIAGLAERLRSEGLAVTTTREPGAGPLGVGIRNLLLHQGEIPVRAELLLFLADRANHVASVISPALERGEIVLCDRFADSTVAYQALARGLDAEFVRLGNAFAVEGVWPLRTYLLDLPVREGLARAKGADRLDRAPEEFHEKVRAGFLQLARAEPGRWRIVDAQQPAETVLAEVLDDLRLSLAG
jgi:dTMP kinase